MKISITIINLFIFGTIWAQKNNVAVDNYWSQGKAEVNVYEVSQIDIKRITQDNLLAFL